MGILYIDDIKQQWNERVFNTVKAVQLGNCIYNLSIFGKLVNKAYQSLLV